MGYGAPSAHEKVCPALLAVAQASPGARVRAIVGAEPPLAERSAEAERLGLVVHHVFRLRPGLAVEGAVEAVLTLAARDWVRSVELDREVTTRDRCESWPARDS